LYLEVYPDVIFILNFFIDFILLLLLKKVNQKRSKKLRLIGAAAVGALFAVFVSVFPWINIVIRFVLMNVVASVLMLIIAFDRMKIMDLLKQVIVFYLLTYFVGGLMNSIYYYTNFRVSLMRLGNITVFEKISWKFVVVIILAIIPVTSLALWLFRWYRSNLKEVYMVDLYLDNRKITTRGLMDTGNCLYDPIFKRPVMIVEYAVLKELLTEEFSRDIENLKRCIEDNNLNWNEGMISSNQLPRIKIIPYQSIGKAQGLMLGIQLDQVIIHTGKENKSNEKVTAAICDIRLSQQEDYHTILHKELV
jgi:stage II sporulation protein GA (sporulation sigma-E factor processing peptidase)